MAHFKIDVNTETGEVVLSASKKVKESLENAIGILESSGYDSSAANATLACLIPINMSTSERHSKEVEGEDEDIIHETTFEASADILNQAILDALEEIIGDEDIDEDIDEDEE